MIRHGFSLVGKVTGRFPAPRFFTLSLFMRVVYVRGHHALT